MAENETLTASEGIEDVAEAPSSPVEEAQPEAKSDLPIEVKRAMQKANKEAETLRLKLKEYEDRDKSELQLLQEERDSLKAERDTLHLETLRREVAEEKGLTLAQARRLVGSTREELESDADDVIATFPIKAAPKFGDVGQGQRGESAPRVYTTNQLNDFAFFQKHKDDILAAQKEGRIVTE